MRKNVDLKYVFGKMPERKENSNKSDFGRILNIAGSINYSGAAYLSSLSALRTGAGYIMLAAPSDIIPVIASMAPEITFMPLKSKDGAAAAENEIPDLSGFNVVSMGCGLTNTAETQKFFFKVLKAAKPEQKLIIDADGINILGSAEEKPAPLKNAVITPHPKELARLLHVKTEEILENREKYARIASETYECITILKGHDTIITDGSDIYINKSGSSALAKAGSGDVLTGIISGLAAQNMKLLDAAVLGVFLHGLAGDTAADDLSEYSVLASDIIDYIPLAVKQLTIEE